LKLDYFTFLSVSNCYKLNIVTKHNFSDSMPSTYLLYFKEYYNILLNQNLRTDFRLLTQDRVANFILLA